MGASAGTRRNGTGYGLVGAPVRVELGISIGEHGFQEAVAPGTPMTYKSGDFSMMIRGYCWTFILYPISTLIFLIVWLGQCCAPCCYGCLGNAWCLSPSQIAFVHALYVVWHTVKHTWYGYVCCCGWFVKLQPGILLITLGLPTPPRFIFDEDKEVPYLLPFDEYVTVKAKTFPPFSGKYRAVDGGGNNAKYTFIGQGGRGYGMNEPFQILHPSVLPDPDLMSRDLQLRTTFRESPFGQNSISTWFANIAIHEFFRSATGADNKLVGGVAKQWVNLHSGYLDLQTLYGFNKDIADGVRAFADGKLDRMAETRFTANTIPETQVILEMLRREHNWVCDQLKQRYPHQFATDEALYQQARLIMGGVFINLVLRQYGDQMFGESAPGGRGFAELRQRSFGCWPAGLSGLNNQTAGNHSTFNFNLIYRWHTGIPQEWDPKNLPPAKTDEEIRQIFLNAYQWKAGGFGPNNVPEGLFMRQISVPAAEVRQGRLCGAPRLNDFRRRIATPYKSFEEMTGDPEVARRLAKWYPSVEDVELAVGVQVERAMPGGWCLGETTAYAILFDAFNSIRQDRFYTTDFTPEVYTPWGLEHAKSTILVDILNRHLNMGLDRDGMLARIPGWKGPPQWSELKGYPFCLYSFDQRGFPILK